MRYVISPRIHPRIARIIDRCLRSWTRSTGRWLAILVFLLASPLALSQAATASSSGTAARVLWILIAYGLAVLLFVIELFLPSGGVLALGSAVAAIVGIVLMFQVSTTIGLIGLTVTLIALPFLIGYALKLLPDTPLFRWMTLSAATPGSGEATAADPAADNTLVGQLGTAATDLYPSGSVLIDGHKHDAASICGQVDKGEAVEVIGEDAFGLKVRRVGD